MNYIKLIAYLSIFSSFLIACEGDPGPEGPQGLPGEQGPEGPGAVYEKRGYFSGTVSGTRRDGTSFSEGFNYEYASTSGELFSTSQATGETLLTVRRQHSTNHANGYISLQFKVLNKGTSSESLVLNGSPSQYSTVAYFSFIKELSPTSLFSVTAYSGIQSLTFRRIIGNVENEQYKFAEDEAGRIQTNYFYDESTGLSYYYLFTEDGKKIYYEDNNRRVHPNFGYYYGAFYKIVSADGSESTTSSLYSNLHFSYGANGTTLRDASTGEELLEVIYVPEDEYELTNYSYDAATGMMSFSFTITIGGDGRYNTTKHPLTITGSFSSGGKIYSSITGRNGQ